MTSVVSTQSIHTDSEKKLTMATEQSVKANYPEWDKADWPVYFYFPPRKLLTNPSVDDSDSLWHRVRSCTPVWGTTGIPHSFTVALGALCRNETLKENTNGRLYWVCGMQTEGSSNELLWLKLEIKLND